MMALNHQCPVRSSGAVAMVCIDSATGNEMATDMAALTQSPPEKITSGTVA